MAKKTAQVIQFHDAKVDTHTERLRVLLKRRHRDKYEIGELLCKVEPILKKNGYWTRWLEKEFTGEYSLSDATARRYMEFYEQNQQPDVAIVGSGDSKKSSDSGRSASAGGRGGGGGKGTATTTPSAAVPPPSSSPPPPDAPRDTVTVPASVLHTAPDDLQAALLRAVRAEETNAKLLMQIEALDAQVEALEARIDRMTERTTELDAENYRLRAGQPAPAGEQTKKIARLEADLADVEAKLESARTPTPAHYVNMFMLLPDKDQVAIIREIADSDAAEPGAYDLYRAKYIELLFAKIRNEKYRSSVINKLKPPVRPADPPPVNGRGRPPEKIGIPPRREFPHGGAM